METPCTQEMSIISVIKKKGVMARIFNRLMLYCLPADESGHAVRTCTSQLDRVADNESQTTSMMPSSACSTLPRARNGSTITMRGKDVEMLDGVQC